MASQQTESEGGSPVSLSPIFSSDSFTLALSFFLMNPLSMCKATTFSGPRAALRRAVHTALSTPPLTRDCGRGRVLCHTGQ